MAKARAHVLITGLVQGVGFRGSVYYRAAALGLTGWVMNHHYDAVEAVFEGEEESVHQMVQWCHRGPSSAIVKQVEVDWQTPTGEFHSFNITS
jgi:acylphosphatase